MVDPLVRSVPRGRVTKLGREAVEFNRSIGIDADDWQEMILLEALRINSTTGLWRSFEVGVDLSRQNGKGGLLEQRQLPGLFLLREPLQVYSSHQFDTSLEAFRRLLEWVEGMDELRRQVKRVARSHGEEGIELYAKHGERSGPRIRFRTRTKGGGRGFTADCLYLDEAMIISEASHGALLPTLSARANPQVWYTGSPVDEEIHDHGVVFARVRERGHRGDDPALSFYEWSIGAAHPDEVTPEMAADPENWRRANPALGKRIRESIVENEQRSMDPRTFAVERLGVGAWPRTDRVGNVQIDLATWDTLADAGAELEDPVCLAFDVSPERQGSICAGGRSDGQWCVEVVDSRPGTGWMVARLVELVERHRPTVVRCAGTGLPAALIAPLEAHGVIVEPVAAAEHGRACARFADYVAERSLRHLGQTELRSAIRLARTRPLGDSAWAWSRKDSTGNISPLVSATLAVDAAVEHQAAGSGFAMYSFSDDDLAAV